MSALSDYLENKVIDWLFRAQAYSPPATLYFGLFTATPSDTGGGSEVSGNGYARVGVTPSLANFAGTQSAGSTSASSGSNGTTSNNVAITFPTPTPSGWGTVVAVGIFDALSGGNLLVYSPLVVNKVVNPGDVVNFPIGQLQFQIDN